MTIAEQARRHPLWTAYVDARERGNGADASYISRLIADGLGLTDRQRLVNLPKIARQSSTRGKPRKVRCEHCGQVLR